MDKRTGIILAIIIVIFGVLLTISLASSKSTKINYDNYEVSKIISSDNDTAKADTGGFGDIVLGNPDAPVIVFEYGDYQCTACAPMNPYVNQIIEDYDGKVAVVFRTMIMSYHQNGNAAAAAALAAYNQGYWKEFKDIIFANQNEWYYADSSERQDFFDKYFLEASNNQGDIEQFHKDIASKEVAQKIKFDAGISDKRGIEWTPTFYVEDQLIDNYHEKLSLAETADRIRELVDARLKELGLE